MTLNITLAAPWGIYQSCDFRLTDANTGRLVTDTYQKLIIFNYFERNVPSPKRIAGTIAFTGVGLHGKSRMVDALAKWFDPNPSITLEDGLDNWMKQWEQSRVPTLSEITELIRKNGSQWLATVPKKHRYHSFIIGAFAERKPHVVLISNYETIDGKQLANPADELFVTSKSPTQPEIVVTGLADTIDQATRKQLKRWLRNKPPSVIWNVLAEVNQRASRHPKAFVGKGSIKRISGISSACELSVIYPDKGKPQYDGPSTKVWGLNSNEGYIPHHINDGIDWAPFMKNFLERFQRGEFGPK